MKDQINSEAIDAFFLFFFVEMILSANHCLIGAESEKKKFQAFASSSTLFSLSFLLVLLTTF